jgi:hypothetical protein
MTSPSLLQSAVAIGAAFAVNAARRAAVALMSYLAVGALLAISVGFLTLSAYRAMASSIGEVHGALAVGTSYFIAALIAMLVVAFMAR